MGEPTRKKKGELTNKARASGEAKKAVKVGGNESVAAEMASKKAKMSEEVAVPRKGKKGKLGGPGYESGVAKMSEEGLVSRKGKEGKLGGPANESGVAKMTPSIAPLEAGSLPEPVGMQVYWNLSNVEASVREAASLALVKELLAAQRDYEDRGLGKEERAAEAVILGEAKTEEDGLMECAPAVQYALRRLVRGVASSRESARQGFALALAAVLGALPCIKGEAVIKIIEKNLDVTSSMKGQEARDALLGQLFAYGAIIRSERVIGEGKSSEQQELAKGITQCLLKLAKKKAFLREPAAYLVAELGEKVGADGFEKGVCTAPLFTEFLSEEPKDISPDALLLALRLHDKLPATIRNSCSLLPASGDLHDIFEPDHLKNLVPCLKESSCSHPRVHLLWQYLLNILFSQKPDQLKTPQSSKKGKKKRCQSETNLEVKLAAFWNIVVDGALITSSHERKHLAMQLMLLFLPRLLCLTHIKYLLSGSFVRCLLDVTASKDNLLFKAAQNCIQEICKWAEADEERRIKLILILQGSSHGKFDSLSRTQSVKGLMNGLTTITGYQSLFRALLCEYLTTENLEGDRTENAGSDTKKQKVPSGDTVMEGNQVSRGDSEAGRQRWAIDQLRALCQQALAGLPVNVAVQDLFIKLIPSITPLQPLSEDEEESVARLQATILQLSNALSKVEAGKQKDRLQAFIALLVQLLFESRLVPSVAETASEITICCKNAFGDLVDLDFEDEPDEGEAPVFMDVLVDVLLSLLIQSSAPIRAPAEQVFKAFCGDLTRNGLANMLSIVKKNTKTARHKPVVEVDNQKDDGEDNIDVEESDDDMNEDGSDEDEDESDDSQLVDTKTLVKQGTSSMLAQQNGSKLPDQEDEDDDTESEASDLDDEEMFKFDKHLAIILKQKKTGGGDGGEENKDTQTQLMHFKFRVLSLLEFFLQKQSDSLLVLTILPSLLQVFVNSCTADGNLQVADRVGSILQNKLFKGKHYPKGPEVDLFNLKELLKKSLKMASRSTIKRISVMAQSASYWLIKVILGNSEEDTDKDVEEIVMQALDDFFVSKKCTLPVTFFKEIINRHSGLGNCFFGAVLQKCSSARTEYLQVEALHLISAILGFKSSKSSRKSKQATSDVSLKTRAKFLKSHLKTISAIIMNLVTKPSVKAARRIESLQFCVSGLELYQNLFEGKSLSEFIDLDAFSAAIEVLSAPPKSKPSNLIDRLRQLVRKSRSE